MTYTQAQLDAMDDRTIDATVAEVVMGWTRIRNFSGNPPEHIEKRSASGWRDSYSVPAYSADANAMMQVVEKMRNKGYRFTMVFSGDRVICEFEAVSSYSVCGVSPGRSCCIAAVLAKQDSPAVK